MLKYIIGTLLLAYAAAGDPSQGGSLEDLIHEIFTPPPDLSNKGNNNNNFIPPGVVGPLPTQQPQIEVNVGATFI